MLTFQASGVHEKITFKGVRMKREKQRRRNEVSDFDRPQSIMTWTAHQQKYSNSEYYAKYITKYFKHTIIMLVFGLYSIILQYLI